MRSLILYSKPGCHLCEGLQEKLEQIQKLHIQDLEFQLEIRDITTQEQWFQAYQYEIPVLYQRFNSEQSHPDEQFPQEQPIPRPSPRLNLEQLSAFLQAQFRTHSGPQGN